MESRTAALLSFFTANFNCTCSSPYNTTQLRRNNSKYTLKHTLRQIKTTTKMDNKLNRQKSHKTAHKTAHKTSHPSSASHKKKSNTEPEQRLEKWHDTNEEPKKAKDTPPAARPIKSQTQIQTQTQNQGSQRSRHAHDSQRDKKIDSSVGVWGAWLIKGAWCDI